MQTGRAELMCAMPGRTAVKAAPVTPRISIRLPLGAARRALESERIGAHMWAGEPWRYTITRWPTRRQYVLPLSRLPSVSVLPGGAGFAQVTAAVGLALPAAVGVALPAAVGVTPPAAVGLALLVTVGVALPAPAAPPADVPGARDPHPAVARAMPVTRAMPASTPEA